MLNENTIEVSDYAQLKAALADDNGFTNVLFANDISATNIGGIIIHKNKPEVMIDGQGYTFSQYATSDWTYTIRVESDNSTTKSTTVKNMTVVGQNYWGIVHVRESVSGVTVKYEDMDYTGPQALHNRSGTGHFVNSSFTMRRAASSVDELAEVRIAVFEGNVNVDSNAGSPVVRLTNSNTSFTILPGADVNIITPNYFVHPESFNAPAVIGAGARLTLNNGFTYLDRAFASFTMEENARVHITHNASAAYATIRVASLFEMRAGADLSIIRTGVDGIPIRFTTNGGRAVFNNPERVQLYSTSSVLLRFTSSGALNINTSAMNLWTAQADPGADSMDIMPDHIWNRAGHEGLTLNAAYNNTTTQSVQTNLTGDDPVVSELNPGNFNMEKTRMLLFGRFQLGVDVLDNSSVAIKGSTEPGAAVRAWYTTEEAQQQADGAAAGSGLYSIGLSGGKPEQGSIVTVIANHNKLKMRQNTTVADSASNRLAFLSVPDSISFLEIPVPGEVTTVPRQNGGLSISVEDTRLSSSPWRLEASVPRPLTATVNGQERTLPGAMVFANSEGGQTVLNEDPATVYSQEGGTGGTFDLQWNDEEGVLLQLAPGLSYSGAQYQASIHWGLVDAP